MLGCYADVFELLRAAVFRESTSQRKCRC